MIETKHLIEFIGNYQSKAKYNDLEYWIEIVARLQAHDKLLRCRNKKDNEPI